VPLATMMIQMTNKGDGSHPCCLVLLWPPPLLLCLLVDGLGRLRGNGSSGDCCQFTGVGKVASSTMEFGIYCLHTGDLVLGSY
jgi:hypothetical protein